MNYKEEPKYIILELSIDTLFLRSFKTENKAEFEDGTFAFFHNVNYSPDWTKAKQAGYFWGRIMHVALDAEAIEEDFDVWKNGTKKKVCPFDL